MKWFWWNRSWADIVGILLVVAVAGVALMAYIHWPDLQRSNAGFKPDWECAPQAQGGPICIKTRGK